MTGIEFPGWRLTVPTWRAGKLPPFLLTILFVCCAAESRVIPAIRRFLAQPRSSNTAELTSFVEALRFTRSGCRLCWKEHCPGQQMQCLYFAFQGQIPHLLFIMFVVPLAMLGSNALTALLSLGLRGFVSHDNIPSLGPDSRLLLHPLLSVSQCLSRVVEVLHNLVVVMQLELPSILSNVFSYVLSVGPLVPYFQRRFKPFQPSRCQNV